MAYPLPPSARASAAPIAALVTLLVAGPEVARAQATLPEVRVEARGGDPATERASVGGLSDAPVSRTPQAISVIRSESWRDLGADSVSAAVRGDTSTGDAYNTIGYVETLEVRGFTLDNAQNFLRDGLAISNHAPMALENKEAIEILKGVSGLQSAVSAPGGMVNYVLKRPTSTTLRNVFFGLSEKGTTRLHGDFGGRAGEGGQFGYRVNLVGENRRPEVDDAHGQRGLVSGFFDLRLPGNALLEAEFEYQRVNQISVPGFGLLDSNGDGVADTLPAPIDPRINLNNQPWSQPFESRNAVGSLRFQQAFATNWFYGLRYGEQRITTNDRTAFPDGCSSGPTYVYPGFCGNYDFDVYDYRSLDERRRMRDGEAYVRGEFATGAVRHEMSAGVRRIHYTERYQPLQAYNWVGVDNVFDRKVVPEDPTPSVPNTQRNARTDELYLTDTMRAGPWSLWLGLRHSKLSRSSERTDGSESVSYDQSFTTPWGAIGYQPWEGGFAYVSAGSGVETEVVPNRPLEFDNYGQVLPAVRSTQVELGYKQVIRGAGLASIALFDIRKPSSEDVAQPDGTTLRVADGREARHRGIELAWTGRPTRSLALAAQATLLDAEITRSLDPSLVGKRTTNVPPVAVSVQAGWDLPTVPGMTWINRAIYSGSKEATRDNSISLPWFWQWDTAIVYRHRSQAGAVTWRLGIDNVLDRRYWREAPTQYWGGVYLFPAMPRTFSASVALTF